MEFFFFAILIGVVAVVFAIMAYFYKYVSLDKKEDGVVQNGETDESTALIPDEKDKEDDVIKTHIDNMSDSDHPVSEF